MKKNESIEAVMTPAQQLQTVHIEQKLSDVRKILADPTIHHVPVLHGNTIVGLISATDMLKMTFTAYGGDDRSFDAYLDHEFTVEQVMTRSLTTLPRKATIRDAAQLLAQGTFHAVPVIEGDTFEGLVTSKNLIAHLRDLYS